MRRPSPALVVATIALFVALSGTAVAGGGQSYALAKRALLAENAKKLGGQTPAALLAKAKQAADASASAAAEQAARTGQHCGRTGDHSEDRLQIALGSSRGQ